MNGLKDDLSLSLFYKISLNVQVQWSEENVRNVSYTCVTMQSFFHAAVSSISIVHFTIERSRKTKLGNLSTIIHQKLPKFV